MTQMNLFTKQEESQMEKRNYGYRGGSGGKLGDYD